MRPAVTLAAGILFAVFAAGTGPASAAPGLTPGAGAAGDAIVQVRMARTHRYRRGARRVMGLPTPGTRARHSRTRLPRL
ncbi:hypothetical protein [Methylobacterium sp. J-076]|uniref:hypothetical protein n=1 Tax=Methylobacterium sp. J-076 TaxID=2836655 RepID=UPI001FB9FDCD|nr:hypothetical protein [Methylobacterium sp. J-076]MCJ2014782.1 hypothetical protein [Methylobacterium sp. J-076]